MRRTADHRRKVSTTLHPRTYAYLRRLVQTRQARNLSHAVDIAVERVRRAENRARLARDTAAYFKGLSNRDAAQEARLETALDAGVDEINFDR